MPPKRKADDMNGPAPGGKKTMVKKKTTVTTVTIEEPKKNDAEAGSSSKKKSSQPKARKSPDAAVGYPDGSHYSVAGGPSSFPGPPIGYPPSFGLPNLGPSFAAFPPFPSPGDYSPMAQILPSHAYPTPLQGSSLATSGQMPMHLQSSGKQATSSLALPSSSSSSAALVESKKKAESGGKHVWLIYHKSGRQDAQLMGVYTAARTALKNAKAVIDKETGGVERRKREEADLSDFSSNIHADHGVVYEAKYKNGGKNVVSFKKVKLNEDLSDGDEGEDDGDDVLELPSSGIAAALKAADRAAIGWL